MFGFIKAFDSQRRIGIIETAVDGNINFILQDGEPVPNIGANVEFSVRRLAVELTYLPEITTRTYRG